jgi:hypothetical protein
MWTLRFTWAPATLVSLPRFLSLHLSILSFYPFALHELLSPWSLSLYLSIYLNVYFLVPLRRRPCCLCVFVAHSSSLTRPYTPLHALKRPQTGAYALHIALPLNALKCHGRMCIHARVRAVIVQAYERESRTAPVLYLYRLRLFFLFFSDIMLPIPIWTDVAVYLFRDALYFSFFLAGGGGDGGTRRGGASTAFA